MRTRRPSPAQQEAVARRLALLDAELSAVRGGDRPTRDVPDEPVPTWDVAPSVPGGPPPVSRWAPPDTHTRPRAARHPGDPADPPDPPGPADPIDDEDADGAVLGAVPRVGRHAHRRLEGLASAPGLRDRLADSGRSLVPETLLGRAGLGTAHLAVVAVLVSVGLGLTCWWVLRLGPEPLPATAPVSAPVGALVTPSAEAPPGAATPPGEAPTDGAGGTPVAGDPASAASPAGEVVVDVAGRVRRPGIVVLPAGSRVADALEAAGGSRAGTDLTPLNLARVLLDGEQVLVGVDPAPGAGGLPVPGDPAATPGVPGSSPAPGVPSAPTALVNVNTADLATLDTLPGVGPVTAQAIVDWRTENGGFSAVADLLDVSGIGEVTLAELTPLVTV